MHAESMEKLKVVAGQLEDSLRTFETILESDDIAALYPASRGVLAALRALYDAKADLLPPAGKARIEELVKQEQSKRGGRDSFNTGF